MTPVVNELIQALVATLRNPRAAAGWVMRIDMQRQQRWEILLLIAVLSAVLAYLSLVIGSLAAGSSASVPSQINPIMLGISQLIVMVVMVLAIHLIGRWAGGTGELDDAILLVAWMQFILLCLQLVQIVAVLVFPFLALLIGLAGLILLFMLLTIFISQLHGFTSIPSVFFSVLFVMLILATFIRFVFSMFGFDVIGVL